MRKLILSLFVALVVPLTAGSQAAPKTTGLEKFDVAGLPKVASSPEEQQIFQMLRYHKRGDLKDATRIHMLLSEYYKARGEKERAADCAKQAADAWAASERGIAASADAPGTPPFEVVGAFRQTLGYADDIGLSHRWQFFDDGTWQHTIIDPKLPDAQALTEVGWYRLADGSMRLWQSDPPSDHIVPFTLQGKDGKDGAVMDGVKMKVVK